LILGKNGADNEGINRKEGRNSTLMLNFPKLKPHPKPPTLKPQTAIMKM